jgi:hypothetical protein
VNQATGGLDDYNEMFTDCLLQPQSIFNITLLMSESKPKIGKSDSPVFIFHINTAILLTRRQT